MITSIRRCISFSISASRTGSNSQGDGRSSSPSPHQWTTPRAHLAVRPAIEQEDGAVAPDPAYREAALADLGEHRVAVAPPTEPFHAGNVSVPLGQGGSCRAGSPADHREEGPRDPDRGARGESPLR